MNRKSIRLSIFDNFECAGEACPDSCCHAWYVNVDDKTYLSWQELEESDAKENLISSVFKVKEKRYEGYRFKKSPNNKCVNLTPEGLCWIHADLGHDALPTICREYPRVIADDTFASSSSLQLSCPEATRMLFNEGLKNQRIIVDNKNNNREECENISLSSDIAEPLFKLVIESIDCNKYPAHIILTHIAQVISEIGQLSESGALSNTSLNELSSNAKQKMYQINLNIKNKNHSSDNELSGRFLRLSHSAIPDVFSLLPDGDSKSKNELIELIHKDNQNKEYFEELSLLVMKYREEFYKNLPNNYHNLMRNYLRAKFLNNYFPWNPVEGNIIAGFLYCSIPYVIIQLLIWTQFKLKGKISIDDIIHITQKVEKNLDHTSSIYEVLSKTPELLRLDRYANCFTNI